MPKHIGIVACSAEGAALCYRVICSEAADELGEHAHPEITMHTHALAQYMTAIKADDWKQVAKLMLSSAEKLANCGAEFAICPDNTIHQAFEFVLERSPIPWLHIADCVAAAAKEQGFQKLGIAGTKYLMTGPVYPESLAKHQIEYEIPDPGQREYIDQVIFGELVKGVFTKKSRQGFSEIFASLRDRGCDAVIMGCTEIPLLMDPSDTPIPTLDSTRLLARNALEKSLL